MAREIDISQIPSMVMNQLKSYNLSTLKNLPESTLEMFTFFLCNQPNLEGFWEYKSGDTISTSDDINVITTSNGKRLIKRTFSNIKQTANNTKIKGSIAFGSVEVAGEMFHIGDGNMLLEGGGEVAQKFKRDFTTGGVRNGVQTGSGQSVNPIFSVGRIIEAGDGDPEIRIMYSDDNAYERTVFEIDRKGIVASVKTSIGSHYEGFISLTDENPVFRLNSYPRMRLEMGLGGVNKTDVAVERLANGNLGFYVGDLLQCSVTSTGDIVDKNNINSIKGIKRAISCTFPSAMANMLTEIIVPFSGAILGNAVCIGYNNSKGMFYGTVSNDDLVKVSWANNSPIMQDGFTEVLNITILK